MLHLLYCGIYKTMENVIHNNQKVLSLVCYVDFTTS